MGTVEPLTARGVTAVIRHMQNPSRPVDYMAGLTPMDLGEPSHDEFSAHIVDSIDPETGQPVQWWHRTAAIHAEDMAVAERTPLWLVDALVGRELDIVRTLSFQIELVPAAEAKQAAKGDVVKDMADQLSETSNGQIGNDETSTRVTAALRRRALQHTPPLRHTFSAGGSLIPTLRPRSSPRARAVGGAGRGPFA